MGELKSEETVGYCVESDCVVSAHGGDEAVEVGLVGSENEGVVHVDDDIYGFGVGGAVEEAGVEWRDVVVFGKEGSAIVRIE